jgi:hypothetical protein
MRERSRSAVSRSSGEYDDPRRLQATTAVPSRRPPPARVATVVSTRAVPPDVLSSTVR